MSDNPQIASGVREGDVLAGKYRIDKILGAGGMGVVVAAHHMQLDNRDLKPANLFVIRRPDGALSVKVLDFGISKTTGVGATGSDMTSTSAVMARRSTCRRSRCSPPRTRTRAEVPSSEPKITRELSSAAPEHASEPTEVPSGFGSPVNATHAVDVRSAAGTKPVKNRSSKAEQTGKATPADTPPAVTTVAAPASPPPAPAPRAAPVVQKAANIFDDRK